MKRVIFGLITVLVVVVLVYLIPTTRIDLTKYETSIDYGSLNSDQIKVMDTILLCGTTGLTIIEHDLSYEEFNYVIDYIGFYFGTNLAHQNIALWRPGYAEVNPDIIISLEKDKAVLDEKIDNIDRKSVV